MKKIYQKPQMEVMYAETTELLESSLPVFTETEDAVTDDDALVRGLIDGEGFNIWDIIK